MREFNRVLITGATGAGARCLIEYLQKHHAEVQLYGTVRRRNSRKLPVGVSFQEVDLLDSGSIARCLWRSEPDVIFHLAANPDKGFEIPAAIIQNNLIGTVNLFEAVRNLRHQTDPVIVNVSSSEIYGIVKPDGSPITEDSTKNPFNPYAVAKLAQDNLASVYYKAYGMQIITVRPCSYNNFYRNDLFTSDFARQIARIEQGKQTVLKHGNLEGVRLLCDARDMASALWAVATKCRHGEAYNIGGGQQVTVGEVLDRLLSCSYIKNPRIPCEPDPALMRPVDLTLQVPDCTKFKKETGWEPEFDLDRGLKDLLNYWRKEVAKK